VDKSGSMGTKFQGKTRMQCVIDGVLPFLLNCPKKGITVKVVMFDRMVKIYDLPKSPDKITEFVKQKFRASGGTSFTQASSGLVLAAEEIQQELPGTKMSVVVCSDGETSKADYEKGHEKWKSYANTADPAPFVSTIGVSEHHDADVLAGYISGENGLYENAFYRARGDGLIVITQAFERVLNRCMDISLVNMRFPVPVFTDICSNSEGDRNLDLAVGERGKDTSVWVSQSELLNCYKRGVFINGETVPIRLESCESNSILDQRETLMYYNDWVRDLVSTLRDADSEQQVRERTSLVQSRLNKKLTYLKHLCRRSMSKGYEDVFQALKDEGALSDTGRKRLLELQKKRRAMKSQIQFNKRLTKRLQENINEVQILFKEVLIDKARLQNIRKHILDLQFSRRAAMRIEKFTMTESEIVQREASRANLPELTEEQLQEISNEEGSGCFLSTYTLRDIVRDQDTLWICGYVDRRGGSAMECAETLDVKYISPHLVSGSFFDLAIEACPEGFRDPNRELVNACLLSINANDLHAKISHAYSEEYYTHALSGRRDIWGPGPEAIYRFLAILLLERSHTTRGKELLNMAIRSQRQDLSMFHVSPLNEGALVRGNLNRNKKIKITEISRDRVMRYIENPEFRTSRISEAKYGIFLAEAALAEKMDIPDHFFYDYCLQFVRERLSGMSTELLEWLVYLLLEDHTVPADAIISSLRWNKVNLKDLFATAEADLTPQHMAWLHGSSYLESIEFVPITETKKRVIDFVMKDLNLEQINRAYRYIKGPGDENIEGVSFSDPFLTVAFCCLALRMPNQKVPPMYSPLMKKLCKKPKDVIKAMRKEIFTKLEMEKVMLWKNCEDDSVNLYCKAFEQKQEHICNALQKNVKLSWSKKCESILSSGLSRSIAGYISCLAEPTKFSVGDRVFFRDGDVRYAGFVDELNRDGTYVAKIREKNGETLPEKEYFTCCKTEKELSAKTDWYTKGTFNYRPCTIPNRHGHGNCCPKDYKLRYAAFGERLGISEDMYESYYRTARLYNRVHRLESLSTSPEDVYLNPSQFKDYNSGMRLCIMCSTWCEKAEYSWGQWRRKGNVKCKDCTTNLIKNGKRS